MRRAPTRVALALAAAVALDQAAAAAPRVPRETVRVDYVLLDVLALDGKGRLVTDLTAADFVVSENRRRIRVESFDTLDLRRPVEARGAPAGATEDAAAAAPAVGTGATPSLRYLLAIDLEFARTAEIRRAFGGLEELLARVGPRPGFAWMLYSLEDGLLVDGFVENPATVAEALARYESRYVERRTADRRGRAAAGRDVVRGADGLEQLEERFAECRGHAEAGGSFGPAELLDCVRRELAAFVQLEEARTLRVLEELEGIAGRFPGVDGPNSILFVSPGFSLTPGRAAIQLARIYGDLTRSVAAEQRRPGPWDDLGALPAARSFEDRLRRIVHRCLERRVVFHTFDVYGFTREGARRASPEYPSRNPRVVSAYRAQTDEHTGGLIDLAHQTGGYFHSLRDFDRLTSIFDRAGFVYTLGYAPPPGEPRFRKIRVKCKRKGVRLMHRAGYFYE